MERRSIALYQFAPLVALGGFLEPWLNLIFGWGWLLLVVVLLWIIWRLYLLVRMIDYVSAVTWSFLEVTIPEEAEQTPKSMENAFDVWDGIHKGGDLIEKYFDGYLEAWYSCELYCRNGQAKYILVVPSVHKTFFEGVVYGQYPQAEVTEVDDYTQRYNWQQIDDDIDVYSTDIILTDDDIYPVKSYHSYEDSMSLDERFLDPHQAMVEAYTAIPEGHEFWVQILVRPIDGGDVKAWAGTGEAAIDKLAGKEVKKTLGPIASFFHLLITVPADMAKAAWEGPLEASRSSNGGNDFPKVSAADMARMDGILRKIDRGGYRTMIRVVYVAPNGELTKPNIGRLIGGFKQFSTYNLNGFKPDGDTKTNGPNYFFKKSRRYQRKKLQFLSFQWRDFWGYEAGYMMSAEELATIYHFPTRYTKAPAVQRAKAGVGGAPENVPYT